MAVALSRSTSVQNETSCDEEALPLLTHSLAALHERAWLRVHVDTVHAQNVRLIPCSVFFCHLETSNMTLNLI